MTNKKSTKKALLMSALSLLLCCSMLIGTTFAWFTDEVKSGVNTITAGNLDVEVYYSKDADPEEKEENKVTGATKLFTDAAGKDILWEPGVVAYTNLKVVNEGTLELKYQFAMNFENENYILGTDAKLSEVLKVAFLDDPVSGTREQILAAAKAAGGVNLKNLMKVGNLAAADEKVYGVVIYWEPSDLDNRWNVFNGAKTSDNEPLHIDLGLKLVATQKDAEQDSFDETYDENAWADGMVVMNEPDLLAALANGEPKIILGTDIVVENGVVIEKDAAINLNGHTITATGENATLFQVGDGANEGKDCDADLTIFGGKLVLQSTNGVLDGTGVSTGAAIAVDFMSTGTLKIEDTEIVGSRRGGKRAVEIAAGEGYLKNVTIDCAYGSGVNAYWGAYVELEDCDITVEGMYSAPYNSVCFSVMYGSELVINSGNYKLINNNTYNTGDTHGGWVGIIMNSGGTITTNGGTFTNVPAPGFNPAYERAIITAENNAPAVATLNLLGGTFIPQEDLIYNGYGDQYYPTFNVPNLIDCGNGVWVAAPVGVDKVIMTAADLAALGGTKINGTYALMADIDMSGYDMKPIQLTSGSANKLTFEGNGHTISNLNLVQDYQNGMNVAALFNILHSGAELNVNDLTLSNVTSTSTKYAAAVVAYNSTSLVINLNNVDVEKATVSAESVAALVSYSTGEVNLTDCDVSDITLSGKEAENKVGAYVSTANQKTCAVTVTNCTNNTTYRDYGRVINGATWNGVVPVTTTQQLLDAIKNAPVGETTYIAMADGTYDGNIDITLAAMGQQAGDVVIKAMEGAKPVITGTVTLGLYERGTTNVAKWEANVTFEGITFDQAAAGAHCISVQALSSITLKKCTIIGDGEYGIGSQSGNNTGPSLISECTFVNAAIQGYGNFCSGLVIDGCTFNDSRVNIGAGNGVTIQNCTFNNVLTDANNGDSFYAIRTSSTGTPITVKNCKINVDSTVNGIAAPKAGKAFAILHNRHASKAWTIENVEVNLTDAALAQTELKVVVTAGGAMNMTNVTVNGVLQ